MKVRLKLLSIVTLIGLILLYPHTLLAARDGGYDVTSNLWAKAVLQVSDAPVTLVWKAVGTEITPSGDQVISGYFYADPNDFVYGSQYNPEVFVKIYIAKSGWCNIAFNHVTVDSVTVYSAHQYLGAAQQTGTAILTNRLVEHQYNGVAIQNSTQTSETLTPSSTDTGYIMTSGLWAKAVLQPSIGPVTLIWKEVGSDITPSGDKVVSGYFYAAPADFAYGSECNPEVFVKIYIAKSGWCNIAFNHVSVDNVDIYSAHNYVGSANQSGTASLASRLVENQYDGVKIDIVIANNTPIAKILIPKEDGRIYPHYLPVLLFGTAYDKEDGYLSSKSLTWQSDTYGGDGLATGTVYGALPRVATPLYTGVHTVALTATDKYGSKGRDFVTIGVESYPYDTTSVHVSGNYAYIVDLSIGGFGVIDVSNPAKPHLVSSLDIPFNANPFLSSTGNFVYIAGDVDGRGNFTVIDMSNPLTPLIVGSLDLDIIFPNGGAIQDIYIDGFYAYLSGSGLIIIDVSDPHNPMITSSLELGPPGTGFGIHVQGAYAYVCGNGFEVINVSDPYNPSIVGSIERLPGYSAMNGGLFVVGNFAYTSFLQVVDISDPANPRLGSSLRLDEKFLGRDIQVHGTNAFVVGVNGRMMVVDLIDPMGLRVIASLDLSATPKDIHIVGNYAYIATWLGGMKIVDITNPKSPKTIGNLGGWGHVSDMGFQDNYSFVACERRGIQVLNISDPHYISNSGFIDTADYSVSLHVADSQIYALDRLGLKIFDIRDPLNPVRLGSLMTDSPPIDISISDSYAYIISSNKFEVVDINDPQHPVLVGYNDNIGDNAYHWNRLFVSGSYAYVPSCNVIPGDTGCGCLIIDISDPQRPNVVSYIYTSKTIRGIDVLGTYAYLACMEDGFQIVDIKAPHNPILIGSISGPEFDPKWVKVSGNHAFIIGGGIFSAINVSAPQNPYIVDTLKTIDDLPSFSIDHSTHLEINGNKAYIGGRIITVIDISDPNKLVLIDALPAF